MLYQPVSPPIETLQPRLDHRLAQVRLLIFVPRSSKTEQKPSRVRTKTTEFEFPSRPVKHLDTACNMFRERERERESSERLIARASKSPAIPRDEFKTFVHEIVCPYIYTGDRNKRSSSSSELGRVCLIPQVKGRHLLRASLQGFPSLAGRHLDQATGRACITFHTGFRPHRLAEHG
jgi:hypothetical protein